MAGVRVASKKSAEYKFSFFKLKRTGLKIGKQKCLNIHKK